MTAKDVGERNVYLIDHVWTFKRQTIDATLEDEKREDLRDRL